MRSQVLVFNSVNSLSKGFFLNTVKIKYTENYSKFSKCSKSDFARFQRSTGYYKTNNREKRKFTALDNKNV